MRVSGSLAIPAQISRYGSFTSGSGARVTTATRSYGWLYPFGEPFSEERRAAGRVAIATLDLPNPWRLAIPAPQRWGGLLAVRETSVFWFCANSLRPCDTSRARPFGPDGVINAEDKFLIHLSAGRQFKLIRGKMQLRKRPQLGGGAEALRRRNVVSLDATFYPTRARPAVPEPLAFLSACVFSSWTPLNFWRSLFFLPGRVGFTRSRSTAIASNSASPTTTSGYSRRGHDWIKLFKKIASDAAA